MKFLKILPFLFFMLLITSCGEDEPLTDTIINTFWRLESYEQTGCENPEDSSLTEVNDDNCLVIENSLICNLRFHFLSRNGSVSLTFDEGVETFDELLDYNVDDFNNEVTVCGSTYIPDCTIGIVDGDTGRFLINQEDLCMGIIEVEKD